MHRINYEGHPISGTGPPTVAERRTRAQAARELNLSTHQVDRMIRSGQLPAWREEGGHGPQRPRVFVHVDDLEAEKDRRERLVPFQPESDPAT